MQLHLDGSTTMNAAREKVFGLLTDPHFLAKTLPDAEDVRVLDPATLEAKLKLRIAVVSSTLRVRMTVADKVPPSKAKLLVEGTGSGSNLRVTSTFDLEGENPTMMRWAADAEITGVMAGIGSTLLKGFATKKVAEIFAGITKAIEDSSR